MTEGGGYMLSTDVFSEVLDGRREPRQFTRGRLFATHVQLDEIRNITDRSRRGALLALFSEITSDLSPQVLTRWGQAKWGTEANLLEAMRRDLDALDERERTSTHDVLIMETAFRYGWVLVTSDRHLFEVMVRYGGTRPNAHLLSPLVSGCRNDAL